MKPVSPQVLYDHCYGRYAIAAVNVFTMEQVHAVFAAAAYCTAPVIVQITPAARQYGHPIMLHAMVQAAARIYPQVVYALHLDHGTEAHALAAVEEDFTSIMIDASHEPFEHNVMITQSVVEAAHARGICVEAELGVLSGVEDDMDIDAAHASFTNPQQAALFVEQTGCDSLAVAVGTSHGAYKFSGGGGLRFAVLKAIQEQLPGYPLVLHGASMVDPAVVTAINNYGGNLMQGASGVSAQDIQQAIAYGICKVNIATDLRLLWTLTHRTFFATQPALFDPVIPGKNFMEACKALLATRFEVLGATGKSKALHIANLAVEASPHPQKAHT